MPWLAANVSTTTPDMRQLVGAQGGGPSPGAPQRPPRQGFAFRLARQLVLPQAQNVVQYTAAGVIPH